MMRKNGYSLSEISQRIKISKSTASLWLHNTTLDQKALSRLARRQIIGRKKTIMIKINNKNQLLEQLRIDARNDIKLVFNNSNVSKLICAILFWCEGNKSTNLVKFTNSDPEMIKYYLALLRNGFKIDESKLRALVHLHEYHDENKQIDFWSKLTEIPKNQFYKSYIKSHTSKRTRINYPGCICVTYYDALLAKKLWAYYKEAPQILGA